MNRSSIAIGEMLEVMFGTTCRVGVGSDAGSSIFKAQLCLVAFVMNVCKGPVANLLYAGLGTTPLELGITTNTEETMRVAFEAKLGLSDRYRSYASKRTC